MNHGNYNLLLGLLLIAPLAYGLALPSNPAHQPRPGWVCDSGKPASRTQGQCHLYRQPVTVKKRVAKVDPAKYRTYLVKTAENKGIDSALALAQCRQESGFNPRAVSKSGAAGILQFMPRTAKAVGIKDRFDYKDNIDGWAEYMGGLLKHYHGDEIKALAHYNGGPGCLPVGGVSPCKETRGYLNNILAMKKRYQEKLGRL